MNKKFFISAIALSFCAFLFFAPPAFALDTPTITAIPKGPNQINLTWAGVTNPGWGYKVEIQSNSDSRYTNWTELAITRNGRNYLPYWVTEPQYTDVLDGSGTSAGSPAQFQMYSLAYGTLYNFRVRTYAKTDAGVETFGNYSNTASATTLTPTTIRYVTPGGAGSQNGTSWANAWPRISSANGVAAGTLVLVRSGSYASDNINPTGSGTQTNRIIFEAEPVAGTTVTITSSSGIPMLLNTNYVIVDGINFDVNYSDYMVQMLGGSRNAIANLEVDANGASGAVAILSSYNLIHYCYLHDAGVYTDQESGYVVALLFESADRNVVQYSNMRRGGHDTGLTKGGADYNQWKNNLHDGGWGLGLEAVGSPICTYNLFEGSVFKDMAQAGHAYKPGIEASGNYNTVRRNIVYDGYTKGLEISDFTGAATGAIGNLVYNNTVVHNGDNGIVNWSAVNNKVKNNIFYDNTAPEFLDDAAAKNNVYERNLFSNPSTANIISIDYGSSITLAAAASSDPSEFINNYDSSKTINFLDYANRELHLKSNSQLIDLGVSVTDSTWGTIGYSGSAPDLGAFEYFTAGTAPPDTTAPAAPTGVTVN